MSEALDVSESDVEKLDVEELLEEMLGLIWVASGPYQAFETTADGMSTNRKACAAR